MKLAQTSLFLFLFLIPGIGDGHLDAQEDDPAKEEISEIFSGPQVGEVLPEFSMTRVSQGSGESVNVVSQAGQKPVLIIFFHERTRPAFGLMRALTQYGASKKESGLATAVCFLTRDPVELTAWVNRIPQLLTKDVEYGVFPDGLEGPGSYGLNRKVALTILVANKGKVIHNSALVQPDSGTDGPPILKAITEVTGGGDVPDIRELVGRTMSRERGNAEPNMRPWLTPVIQKTATDEEVDKAARALEDHCESDAAARKAIGRISRTVVNSGRLENYGTPRAQDYLRKWAKKYGATDQGAGSGKRGRSDSPPPGADKKTGKDRGK